MPVIIKQFKFIMNYDHNIQKIIELNIKTFAQHVIEYEFRF